MAILILDNSMENANFELPKNIMIICLECFSDLMVRFFQREKIGEVALKNSCYVSHQCNIKR